MISIAPEWNYDHWQSVSDVQNVKEIIIHCVHVGSPALSLCDKDGRYCCFLFLSCCIGHPTVSLTGMNQSMPVVVSRLTQHYTEVARLLACPTPNQGISSMYMASVSTRLSVATASGHSALREVVMSRQIRQTLEHLVCRIPALLQTLYRPQ